MQQLIINPTFPNQSPLPSTLGNNPELGPMAASGGLTALGEIDEGTALAAPDGSQIHTPMSAQNLLMSLRQQFPFLPIMPLPTSYVAIYFDAIGTAEDVFIPDGCSLMMVRGNADYYMSTSGNAAVPNAANTAGTAGSARVQSFYAPQGIMYYVGGIKSISFVASAVGTIVTAMFWSPDQMPR